MRLNGSCKYLWLFMIYCLTFMLHVHFLPCLGGEDHWSARGVVFWAAVSGHQGLFNMAEAQQEGEENTARKQLDLQTSPSCQSLSGVQYITGKHL